MKRVLLVNQAQIPPYRVPIYGYLSHYLRSQDVTLTVMSEGLAGGNAGPVDFEHTEGKLSLFQVLSECRRLSPAAVIFWVNLRYLYLFPALIATKLLGIKVIYWGHGRDLLKPDAWLKNCAYALELWLCDGIILYADHLRKYVHPRFHAKVFVANNTLNVPECFLSASEKESTLARHGISTRRNIICMGRMQRRKRIENLIKAFRMLDFSSCGLILVGPDTEGILDGVEGPNIHKLGAIYGTERQFLLASADVFCIPGAVGLGIVDAFKCGLPIVTEAGDESPESMYLLDGINGFVVGRNAPTELAARLRQLLEDDKLRERFSRNARARISAFGSMEKMCRGFQEAIAYATTV